MNGLDDYCAALNTCNQNLGFKPSILYRQNYTQPALDLRAVDRRERWEEL